MTIGNGKEMPAQLVAYPGYGYQTETGSWKLRISGVAFLTPEEFNIRKRMMIRMLRNAMHVPAEALNCDRFKDRVTPFLVDAEHRQKIFVSIGDHRFRLKKKTSRNGKFQSWISVPKAVADEVTTFDDHGNRTIEYKVSTTHPDSTSQGAIFLLDRNGTSVVSDIDDTIKDSAVTNRRELLANTFLRDFRSVDGMSNVYRQWAEHGFDFHYVSSSPWQLYESLKNLQVEDGFPTGTVHLRNFRFRDQLLKKVLIIRRKGKISAIRSLLKHLPDRKFILVGDSGEKDPEVYRKIGRKFPDQVKGIFIRELEGRRIEPDRWSKVKEPLHHAVSCHKFSTAEELTELAAPVVAQLGTRQLV